MAMYCLICSAARSGSTLLDLMIGGHSKAASLGEVVFLGKALALDQPCSCGTSARSCAGWAKVLNRIRRDLDVDLLTSPYALEQWDARASVVIDRAHQTPAYTIASKLRSAWCDLRYQQSPRSRPRVPLPGFLSKGLHNTLSLYEIVASEWNRELLVDSSKNVHKALAVYERAPDRTRVVFLVRDGRGVYHSRRSSGFSPRQSARGWYKYNRRALKLLEANVRPEHLVRVHYEDLVTRSEEVMRNLSDLLEIDYEPSMLQPNPARHHIVNGNNMRLKPSQKVRLDERWKSQLEAHELQRFQRLTQSMNEALGYA